MRRKLLLVLLLLSPLAFYFFLRGTDSGTDIEPIPTSPLTPDQHLVMGCFALFPGQTFPGSIPWEPFRKIGQQESRALEELAESDPVAFLEKCLYRYEAEVQSYRCIFDKRERVKGKLLHKEKILVHFRAKPFSVHMDWKVRKDIIPIKTLYVEGENDGLMVVRPFFPVVPLKHVKIDDDNAKATSRFDITNFGMGAGARNTLNSMRKARAEGELYLTYEGIMKVPEVGNRFCYKFIRAPHVPPEPPDDVNELIIYIDLVTQLQVGSVLLDPHGNLLAEYFFHDIEVNPKFDAKQFTTKAL